MYGRLLRRFCEITLLLALAGSWAKPLLAHGDIGGQVQGVTEKIQREPGNAALYLLRAELQRHLEHWELAEKDLDTVERLDPKLHAVHLSRALLMLESGKPDKALPSVDKFMNFEPRRADAHETRARILFRLGRLVESEKAFSKAIALSDRPTPDLYLARNEAILARGPGFQSLALKKLDEGISRIGSIVTLELEAVDLERGLQNWNGALQRLERLSSLSPRKEIWLFRRGDILIEAGRHGEAREAYAQALRAIESLPQRNRASAATKQLESQARKHLQETTRHADHK